MPTTAEPRPPALAPSNTEVGRALGLSHSGVSRIRTGDRLPSIRVMHAIVKQYGWGLMAQHASRERGTYAEDFELALLDWANRPQDD